MIVEKSFAAWLKNSMTRNEMSPKELAVKVDVTVGSVYAWLKGRTIPSPRSRKKIIKVFEEAIPTKILITTPLFGNICKRCEYVERCRSRLEDDLPIMCMSITMDDLVIGMMDDCIDRIIWWEEIDITKYDNLEDLANYLNKGDICYT